MSGLAGTGRLARLVLRRDRIRLAVWVLGTPLLGLALVGSVTGFYPDEQSRLDYARVSASSAVARAFNGPVAGSELGAVVVAETYVTLALLAALLSAFAVIRHTRQNEETGRAELLGAAVVGRYALLGAALLVVVGANVVTGALLTAGFVASGLPLAGSVAAGAAIGGVGLAFTAVAAVTAQLSTTSRGANALAATTIGLTFLLRATGDVLGQTDGGVRVRSGWPSWLSPIGWGNQVRAFGGERWWVLALPLALLVTGVAVAVLLAGRRDVGAGLFAARRGPARASAGLLGPAGLTWRLSRGALLGWAVAVAVFGFSMGLVADEVNDMVGDNAAAAEAIAQLGGGSNLVESFLAAMLGLFALTIGAYVVQALLRTRNDETAGLLEVVLAGAVHRVRWLGTQVLGAVLGAVALLLLAGATTGLGYGVAAGDPLGRTAELAGAALLRLPALLVVAGVVTLLFGLAPRWSVPASWAVVIGSLLLGQLGAVLDLPQAALDVSPYTHVPSVPAADATAPPLVALTAVAALLLAAGLIAFHHRDVPA